MGSGRHSLSSSEHRGPTYRDSNFAITKNGKMGATTGRKKTKTTEQQSGSQEAAAAAAASGHQGANV